MTVWQLGGNDAYGDGLILRQIAYFTNVIAVIRPPLAA
jgi:hypothetical protein